MLVTLSLVNAVFNVLRFTSHS